MNHCIPLLSCLRIKQDHGAGFLGDLNVQSLLHQVPSCHGRSQSPLGPGNHVLPARIEASQQEVLCRLLVAAATERLDYAITLVRAIELPGGPLEVSAAFVIGIL